LPTICELGRDSGLSEIRADRVDIGTSANGATHATFLPRLMHPGLNDPAGDVGSNFRAPAKHGFQTNRECKRPCDQPTRPALLDAR
jgi:hypothetical protein